MRVAEVADDNALAHYDLVDWACRGKAGQPGNVLTVPRRDSACEAFDGYEDIMTLFDIYPTLSGLYLNPDELARLILFGADDAGREPALLFAFTDRLIAEARAGCLGIKLWNPEHLDPAQPEPPPRVSVLDAMVWALKHPPRETADAEDPGLQIKIAADTLEWFTRLRPPQ